MQETKLVAPSRRARVLALSCVSLLALSACASAPPPRTDVVRQLSPSEEADAIELAKVHPIATSYDRPRSPGELPVAPAKIPAAQATDALPLAEAQAAPAARDQVVIVGNEPAPQTPPATTYRWPDTSYPNYVDSPYVWDNGAWVARPSYRAYVETPWVGVGVGVGRPWGYGWGYGYNYGYPRAWGGYPYYRPPPVYVPSRPYYAPHSRYYRGYDRPVTRSPTYQNSPRREVYVAPRATSRPAYRAPATNYRSPAPTYRAPAAAPRSTAPVYRAPSAPRSSGPTGGGGRRSVHVR
jgi:hypothetical protein